MVRYNIMVGTLEPCGISKLTICWFGAFLELWRVWRLF